jgi:hypothetical protein
VEAHQDNRVRYWLRNAGLSLTYSVLLLAVLCLAELFAATGFESRYQSSTEYQSRKHWLLRGERERGTLVQFSNYGTHSAPPGLSQSQVLERLRERYPNDFDTKKVVWVLRDEESAFFYRLVPNWAAILFILTLTFACFVIPLHLARAPRDSSYVASGRLADVLALIQSLAFDADSHRSENGLQAELQGTPKSGRTWTDVARAHPELFRVKTSGEHVVSLIARHVTGKVGERREPLSADHGTSLMRLAVDLHDREQERARGWRVWIPLIVTFTASVFTLIGAMVGK